MSEKENPNGGGFVPVDGNWFSIEAERRQADALERIATALEVLAMSAMWRDNGMNAEGGFATSINIAADHFREARDA